MTQVFLAFSHNPEPINGFRGVFAEIESEYDVKVVVVKENLIQSDILNHVRELISGCDFSIVDVSISDDDDWPPSESVLIELGIAIGLGKTVHILKRSGWGFDDPTGVPSDLNGRLLVNWGSTPDLHQQVTLILENHNV